MNNILYPQREDHINTRNPDEGIRENIYPYHHEINITDGGEFLDDAIRMKDQPLGETTEKENE
jgi:hypothetical protein